MAKINHSVAPNWPGPPKPPENDEVPPENPPPPVVAPPVWWIRPKNTGLESSRWIASILLWWIVSSANDGDAPSQ